MANSTHNSLPIIITTRTLLTPTPHRITHTNYKRANWPSFMEQTEQQFLVFNSIPITNIDTSIAQFNSVITNADRAHITRGNRKHYNPNSNPEIGRLIKEREIKIQFYPPPHRRYNYASPVLKQ